MRFTTLAVVVTGICFAAISPLTSRAQDALPALERFSPDQVDKSLDPCNDFFEYACSKWNKANPIPADQAGWGTFNSLAIWNVAAVHQTLETAAKPSPDRTTVEAQVGDYYASCMDTATIDKLGIKPLQPVLDRISAMKNKSDLPEVFALAQRTIRAGDLLFTDAEYTGVLFGLYAQPDFDDASMTLAAFDQAGMGLPARDFYLKDDEKSKTIRDKYLAHIARQLELSGESKERAAKDAASVLALETGLANAAMDLIPRRDPKNQNNKMSLAQAQALIPSFDLARYLQAVHAPSSPQYLVLAPDFFRGIDKLIQSQPLDHWQAYLRWQVVSQMASSLSDPFVKERFDFYGRTLGGAKEMQPRWRRCSFAADWRLNRSTSSYGPVSHG
jgi:putative endopeptidase